MTPTTVKYSKPNAAGAIGRAEQLAEPDAPDQTREKPQQINEATEAANADPEAESEDDLFPQAVGGAHPQPPRPEQPMRLLSGAERAQALLAAQYPSEGYRRLPDVATVIPFSPFVYLDLPAGHYPQPTVDHNAAPAAALEQHIRPQQIYPSNAHQQYQLPPSHDPTTSRPNAADQVQTADQIRPFPLAQRRTSNVSRRPDLRVDHYGSSSVRNLTQESNLLFIN